MQWTLKDYIYIYTSQNGNARIIIPDDENQSSKMIVPIELLIICALNELKKKRLVNRMIVVR